MSKEGSQKKLKVVGPEAKDKIPLKYWVWRNCKRGKFWKVWMYRERSKCRVGWEAWTTYSSNEVSFNEMIMSENMNDSRERAFWR